MAYITLAQAKQALGTDLYVSAYDDVTSPGTPNDTALQEDIDAVSGEIDAALIQTYNTILNPITGSSSLAILKGYAAILLKYEAYSKFDDAEIPDNASINNDRTLMLLEKYQAGLKFLPDDAQDVLAGAITYSFNSATENSIANSTIFKRSEMRGI